MSQLFDPLEAELRGLVPHKVSPALTAHRPAPRRIGRRRIAFVVGRCGRWRVGRRVCGGDPLRMAKQRHHRANDCCTHRGVVECHRWYKTHASGLPAGTLPIV